MHVHVQVGWLSIPIKLTTFPYTDKLIHDHPYVFIFLTIFILLLIV